MVRRNGGAATPAPSAPSVSIDRFFELALLGMVASGYLAVLGSGYLDLPTAAVAGAGLFLRALVVAGLVKLSLSSRAVAALTLAYIGFYPLDYRFVSADFVTATVHLVFFLAVVKVLTASTTRDHIFVVVIAFLELLAASVLSAGLNFFLFLALFMIFGVATFASAEIRRSMRKPRALARGGLRNVQWRLAGLTLSVSLGILALTAALFFLLPRTAQAAFRHLAPLGYHIPGFSNEMVLGEIGEIQKRSTPLMHVRFFGTSAAPSGLKWRGIALSQFDGRRWYNPPEPREVLRVNHGLLELADSEWHPQHGVSYEVQLRSMSSDALFFAGTPRRLRIDAPLVIRTSEGALRLGLGNPDGLHYGAWSALEPPPAVALTESERATYLRLPRLDPRVVELARRVAGEAGPYEGRARAIEMYLRSSYGYTIELPATEVPDPLANFLFIRRKGHCEYFASAMAVMLRVAGIPSRVAAGFQSGVYNPVSGWYVMRASDAHSWVEAWLPGLGWTTFDPTPPDPNLHAVSLWARIGFYLDASETFWREWVLDYNLDRQLVLASRMEDSGRTAGVRWFVEARATLSRWGVAAQAALKRYGPAAFISVLFALALWFQAPRLWRWSMTRLRVRKARRGDARASDGTLLYRRMLAALRKRGFEKPAWITPGEFAGFLPPSDTATLVRRFTEAYNDLRFGGDRGAASRMVELLARIERSRRSAAVSR